MRLKLFINSIFIAFFIVTVSNAQTASIVGGEDKGCAPFAVSFEGSGLITYSWDFGVAGSSNQQNPTQSFNDPGIYTVTLSETDGGPVIETLTITVYEEPIIDVISTNPKGCPSHLAELIDNSTIDTDIPVTSYVWRFNDDGTTQTTNVNNTTHSFAQVQSHSVSLELITAFSSCNLTKVVPDVVEVFANPVTQFTTTPPSLTACDTPFVVGFQNTTIGSSDLNYFWDLDNNDTSRVLTPGDKTFNSPGNYTLSLTASYDFGCPVTTSKIVTIGNPIAEISLGKDSICSGDTAFINSVENGANYRWFVDGNLQSFNQKENIVFFSTSGNQEIQLVVGASGCTDTATAILYVDNLEIEGVSIPDYICMDQEVRFEATSNQTDVEFLWGVQGATFSDVGAEAFETFSNIGDPRYYGINGSVSHITVLRGTNQLGCEVETSATTILDKPNALIDLNVTNGCAPVIVTFEDKSVSSSDINKWSWDFGDGSTQVATDGDNVQHSYTTSGIYQAMITIENDSGCVDTSYAIEIKVGDETTISPTFIVDKTDFCWDEEVTFTNTTVTTEDYSFRFFVGDSGFEDQDFNDCDRNNSTTTTFNHGRGTKDVGIELDYNGCTYETTTADLINIRGSEAIITYEADCATPLVYNFDASESRNHTSNEWTFEGISTSTDEQFVYNAVSTNFVDVTLTVNNADGCPDHTDEARIFPRDVKAAFTKPDSNLCINIGYDFNSLTSEDEDQSCFQAYTWIFEGTNQRPYTTSSSPVTFAFSTPGEFSAVLVAKDINGCTDTTSQRIKIYDIQMGLTSEKTSICLPNDNLWTDTTTGDTTLVSWRLEYGDGTDTTTIGQGNSFGSIRHDYSGVPTTGSVDAILTVTDTLGCSDFISVPLQLYKPISSIVLPDNTLCLGDTIEVSATDFTTQGSNLNYQWDFGNGETSTDQTNEVVYNSAGNFNITLKIDEQATGCPGDSSIRSLQVEDYAGASYTTDKDGEPQCADLAVKFTETSTGNIVSRRWDFGDNEPILTTQNPNHTYEKGTWVTEYIVTTAFGCNDTLYRTFDIISPEGDFTVDKTDPICQSEDITFTISAADTADIVSYRWLFGDGFADSTQTGVVTHAYEKYPSTGTSFPATLFLTGEQGCDVAIEKRMEIIEVVADFEFLEDSSRCFLDGIVNLADSSRNADTHEWDFGNGLTANDAGNKTISYDTAGTYPISLVVTSNSSVCVDTITKQLVLFPIPTINALNDTSCLAPIDLMLSIESPNPTYEYKWTPSTGLSSDSIANPTVNVTSTTEYVATVTDPNACTNSDTAFAYVVEEHGLVDRDTIIVIGDSWTLPVSGSDLRNFSWTPTLNLTCPGQSDLNCDYPIARPLESTVYTVTITDDLGCYPPENVIYDITVRPETHIKLPSTFSPNGDDINDIVYVRGWGIKELVSFEIYNRWGEKIYESSIIEEGWDGRYKGQIQNSDAYAYKVKAIDWRDEPIEGEGYINLIH